MKTPESCAMYSYLLTVWNNCKPDAAPGWTRENCLVWYSRERGSVACSGWRELQLYLQNMSAFPSEWPFHP